MKVYQLPINENELKDINKEIFVNMSNINFDDNDISKQQKAFIYIRNMNLHNLIFTDCNFEEKEKYLLLYLEYNINIDIDILNKTWLKILSYNLIDIECESILNNDEICKFIKNNTEFINEIKQFIISIPICSMNYFFVLKSIKDENIDNQKYNLEYECTDYDRLNMYNFKNLFRYNEFIYILMNITEPNQPLFYNKYFFYNKHFINNPFLSDLINKFPYLSLMELMFNGQNFQNIFIENLNNFLNGGNN